MRGQDPLEQVRQAAHEVQRPVFYAIAIIITAYFRSSRYSRSKESCQAMAWTVAFALLGALMFSMLIAPALASSFFSVRCEGMAQPGNELLDGTL